MQTCWSSNVKIYKEKSLFWHRICVDMGRPYEGLVAQIRRQTRPAYHQAIRSVLKEV